MKVHAFLCALVAATMIFVGCGKDDPETPEPIAPTIDPSVTPTELVFESEAATQSVTVELGSYAYFGAAVDEDGLGWCSVQVEENNIIDITVTANTGELRTCHVNCWVANAENPNDGDKLLLPILVKQEANNSIEVLEATLISTNFETWALIDRTFSYNGGGHTSQVEYKSNHGWYDWNMDEMTAEQHCDSLIIQGRAIRNYVHDDASTYDHDWQVSIIVTGFKEPFDQCKVKKVEYHHTYLGQNSESFLRHEIEEGFVLLDIPLVYHYIDYDGKTGGLSFKYVGEHNVSVNEYFMHQMIDFTDGDWEEINYSYIGSVDDMGEVYVDFNLK